MLFSPLKNVIRVVQSNNIIIIDIKYPHSAPPLSVLSCHCPRLLSRPLIIQKRKDQRRTEAELPRGIRGQNSDHVCQCMLVPPNVCMTEIFKKLTTLTVLKEENKVEQTEAYAAQYV